MINICVVVKPIIDSIAIQWNYEKERFDYLKDTFNTSDLHALQWACNYKEEHGGMLTVLIVADPSINVDLKRLSKWDIDQCILIEHEHGFPLRNEIAYLLAEELKRYSFDLILSGTMSEDIHSGTTPIILSELLAVPLVTNVHNIEPNNGKAWFVHRKESRGVVETYQISLPAIISVNKSIARLRYLKRNTSKNKKIVLKKKVNLHLKEQIKTNVLKRAEPSPNIRYFNIPDATLTAEQRLIQIMALSGDKTRGSEERITAELSKKAIYLVTKKLTKWLKEG